MIFSSNPSENQELNKYAIWLARTFPLSTIEKKSVEKNQHPFIFFIITAGLARTEDEVEITAEYSDCKLYSCIGKLSQVRGLAIDIGRPQSV